MAFETLFSPLEIGPTTLPCRIVSTAHQTTLAKNNVATPELLAYQEARARGGVGLIIMEAAAVEPEGLNSETMMAGYLPETLDGYREMRKIADRHSTKVFVQLFHAGREAHGSGPRSVVVSSGSVPSLRYHSEPRALTTGEAERIIESYARCAAMAAEGGLDGIEITAAHNYLPDQFFDPATNGRNDRFAEPARFLLETIEAVRAAAPGLVVGVRLTADAKPTIAVAPQLAGKVDYMHLTTGDSSTYVGGALIVAPPPWPRNMITGLTAPYRDLGPVLIATGRIVEPADADAFIAAGGADAVGMNRALITDPDMPRKAHEGRVDSVMRCIGCNVCNEHYHAGSPIACGQNPRTGRELYLARPVNAKRPRRIAVVGGGPTGLAAAAEAGAAGHEVRLFEAATELGGQLAIARSAPAKAELAGSLLSNYANLLDRPNVQIELGMAAGAVQLTGGNYDHVLLATGAEPYSPSMAGRGIETLSAWDVLTGERPSGRVVIADWGGDSIGLDAAEVLAADGIRATLVSGALVAGEHLHQYVRTSYLGRMHLAGVELIPHLAFSDAAEGRIHFYNVFAPDLTTEIEADALVVSLGRSSRTALVAELEATGARFATAGDVRSPRGIEEATLEGTLVMRELLGLSAGAGQPVAA